MVCPLRIKPLTVSHDFSTGGLGNLEVFWPMGQVLHVEWEAILFMELRIETCLVNGRDLARIFITGCPNRDFKNLGCPKSLVERVKIITLIMYIIYK